MQEPSIIRAVFQKHHKQHSFYRWLVNNKGWVKPAYAGLYLFLFGRLTADPSENYMGFMYCFFVGFGAIVIGGIDHFMIGVRYRRILDELEDFHEIFIDLSELLDICGDLIQQK